MNGAPTLKRVYGDQVLLLATGFGSGLVPRAPGTAGTVTGAALWLGVLVHAPWSLQTLAVALAVTGGTWLCAAAMSRLEGVHDHPVIVWDEIAGIWLALWLVPPGWIAWLAALALFRALDIVKPWPIGLIDRRVRGGLGVMADDLLAGAIAGIVVAVAMYSTGVA